MAVVEYLKKLQFKISKTKSGNPVFHPRSMSLKLAKLRVNPPVSGVVKVYLKINKTKSELGNVCIPPVLKSSKTKGFGMPS